MSFFAAAGECRVAKRPIQATRAGPEARNRSPPTAMGELRHWGEAALGTRFGEPVMPPPQMRWCGAAPHPIFPLPIGPRRALGEGLSLAPRPSREGEGWRRTTAPHVLWVPRCAGRGALASPAPTWRACARACLPRRTSRHTSRPASRPATLSREPLLREARGRAALSQENQIHPQGSSRPSLGGRRSHRLETV